MRHYGLFLLSPLGSLKRSLFQLWFDFLVYCMCELNNLFARDVQGRAKRIDVKSPNIRVSTRIEDVTAPTQVAQDSSLVDLLVANRSSTVAIPISGYPAPEHAVGKPKLGLFLIGFAETANDNLHLLTPNSRCNWSWFVCDSCICKLQHPIEAALPLRSICSIAPPFEMGVPKHRIGARYNTLAWIVRIVAPLDFAIWGKVHAAQRSKSRIFCLHLSD